MKKSFLLAGTAVLAVTLHLDAAVITQTKTFSGQPNYSSVLTFNKFDDLGGLYTLNSILIEVTLNTAAGARLGIDNDGVNGASGTAEFGSNGSITGADVSLMKQDFAFFFGSVASTSSKEMVLGGDDGDTEVGGTSFFSYSGTDYDELVTGFTTESTSAFISSLVFGQYTGAGTYNITYGVNQYMNMGAFSGVQFFGDPVTTDGEIRITYDYAIPEPGSVSLIMLVVGIAAWIRRRFSE